MKPSPDLVSNAYSMADSGKQYLFYLPEYDTIQPHLDMTQYQIEWISISNSILKKEVNATEQLEYYIPPDTLGDCFYIVG